MLPLSESIAFAYARQSIKSPFAVPPPWRSVDLRSVLRIGRDSVRIAGAREDEDFDDSSDDDDDNDADEVVVGLAATAATAGLLLSTTDIDGVAGGAGVVSGVLDDLASGDERAEDVVAGAVAAALSRRGIAGDDIGDG